MSYIFISARNNEEGKLDFAYLQTDDSLKFLSEEVLPFEENKEKIHNILEVFTKRLLTFSDCIYLLCDK